MRSIQTPTPGSPDPAIEAGGYGMGLTVGHYRARKNVSHSGAIDGMRAAASFLPKEKLGVIALWNLQGSPIGDMLPYVVFDRLLGAPETDWLGRAKAATPVGLSVKCNKIKRPLEHFHFDTFQFPAKDFDQFASFKLSFVTSTVGNIDRLRANLEPNVREMNFTRVAEPAMFKPAFLPKPVVVSLQGASQLLLDGTGFRLAGQTGVSIEFRGDAAGRVTEMATYTPADVFVRRKN